MEQPQKPGQATRNTLFDREFGTSRFGLLTTGACTGQFICRQPQLAMMIPQVVVSFSSIMSGMPQPLVMETEITTVSSRALGESQVRSNVGG